MSDEKTHQIPAQGDRVKHARLGIGVVIGPGQGYVPPVGKHSCSVSFGQFTDRVDWEELTIIKRGWEETT